jgi:hypothetical protein
MMADPSPRVNRREAKTFSTAEQWKGAWSGRVVVTRNNLLRRLTWIGVGVGLYYIVKSFWTA